MVWQVIWDLVGEGARGADIVIVCMGSFVKTPATPPPSDSGHSLEGRCNDFFPAELCFVFFNSQYICTRKCALQEL